VTVEPSREVFWADAEARLLAPGRTHTIRDSKTPSGAVPISSLRGPVITSALHRTFLAHGLTCRFVYTIDDYDPMDSQTMRSREGMAEHMGKPFCDIPSPDPAYGDWARFHGERFIATFAGLGIAPEFHWMRDLYRSGALDGAIDLTLRNAATIREIYARVANVRKDDDWYPVHVICERCGKIGTTKVTGYDGTRVTYACLPDLVDWAEGCGQRGTMSPFKGNAKLPWNLQWCAQWDHFDVTYEEGGKDLLTAGGSRDRSNEIYRAVWKKAPPPGLQHEFLTLGGKKMSTSKGVGAAAHELVELYPPEVVRFLMLRTHPKRHVEFDPAGLSLPKLLDEYDRCGDAFASDSASDLAKVWGLSQVGAPVAPGYRARLGLVAEWLQIPSLDAATEAAKRKGGALDARERADLDRRVALAREWLARWAPEESRFAVAPELPEAARALSPAQRDYLARVAAEVGAVTDPETMQERLYELAKAAGLVTAEGKVSRDAFAALYAALLGRSSGPRAAWLVTTLDPAFVRARFLEAAMAVGGAS